jgi:hypothetical protein
MELHEIREGLVRWTARHPESEADPEPGSPADWPELVGSAFYDSGDAVTFIDPLVPDDGWSQIDELVDGRPVSLLQTVRWHTRSAPRFVERYGAQPPSQSGVNGVEARPVPNADETEFWIPEHRALVVGDRLLGDDAGGLRLCPESWLRYMDNAPTLDDLRNALRPLLELPIDVVITTHGEPVLENGRDAVERALA